jgi:hypothetical protein
MTKLLLNWKGFRRKKPWHNLRFYPTVCLKELIKTMKNLNIAEIQAENETRHLMNTSLKCYHYTSLFCPFVSSWRTYYQCKCRACLGWVRRWKPGMALVCCSFLLPEPVAYDRGKKRVNTNFKTGLSTHHVKISLSVDVVSLLYSVNFYGVQ